MEIPSDELKYYVRNYAKYFDFLIDIGAIEKKNYSTTLKNAMHTVFNMNCLKQDLTIFTR